MSDTERRALIGRIEKIRKSKVICFLTSIRQNAQGIIADDSVRVFFDHLQLLPTKPIPKLDIFLCSNGGVSTVPWRLVALFREYAKSFNVLIPYRAYSAATLLSLGADEIVMHPFGELGPIDPTVSNDFNPTNPQGQPVGINVEDVAAYINFIKSTVGITHEDELVKAIEILAQKVHPLALGNVERFLSQSRMIAKKTLRTHMKSVAEHEIEEIVENMASKLYFHGHPINRQEAKNDLRLKVNIDIPSDLEEAMWALYKEYEAEFQNSTVFYPLGDLLAAAQANPAGSPNTREYDLIHALVESLALVSRHRTKRRYTLLMNSQTGQKQLTEDVLSQGWTHSAAPQASVQQAPTPAPSSSVPVGRTRRKPRSS